MKIVRLKAPNQYFIQVDIEFAVAYGFNEATLAGKMMRLEDRMRGKFDKDGDKWIRMTLSDWAKEFPFWSDSTIRRTIESVTEKKIILTRTFRGRAKWYRLNPVFDGRATAQNEQIPGKTSVQNEQIQGKTSVQNEQMWGGYLFKMNSLSVQNEQLPILNPRKEKTTTTTPDVLDEFTELFTGNFGDLSKNTVLALDVKKTLAEYGVRKVIDAMKTALIDRANGKKKTWGYVKGILRNKNNNRGNPAGSWKNGKRQTNTISAKLERLKTGGMGV